MFDPLDTSAYPKEHTCFAYDQSDEANETVSEVLETVSSYPPKSLKDTTQKLVLVIASALGLIDDDVEMEDDDEDDHDIDMDADGDGDIDFKATHIAQQTAALKQDFLEVVAADWRPGLVRFGSNEFGKFFIFHSLQILSFDVSREELLMYLLLQSSRSHARWSRYV